MTGDASSGLRWRLSQETIAILTSTVALAALILTTTAGVRAEAQADRVAAHAAAEANRAVAQAAAEANRAAFASAMRAMYERTDAERRQFEAEILRLTKEQATRAAVIESRP